MSANGLHLLGWDCWGVLFPPPGPRICEIYDTVRAAFLLSKVSDR